MEKRSSQQSIYPLPGAVLTFSLNTHTGIAKSDPLDQAIWF